MIINNIDDLTKILTDESVLLHVSDEGVSIFTKDLDLDTSKPVTMQQLYVTFFTSIAVLCANEESFIKELMDRAAPLVEETLNDKAYQRPFDGEKEEAKDPDEKIH